MIDPTNPLQTAWLQSVNADMGSLITTNLSFAVQINALNAEISKRDAEIVRLGAQSADMGTANALLRGRVKELEALVSPRKRKNG